MFLARRAWRFLVRCVDSDGGGGTQSRSIESRKNETGWRDLEGRLVEISPGAAAPIWEPGIRKGPETWKRRK